MNYTALKRADKSSQDIYFDRNYDKIWENKTGDLRWARRYARKNLLYLIKNMI